LPRSKKTTIANNRISISPLSKNLSFLQKIQDQIKLDQSYLSLVLGVLIVLVAGTLVFNYFQKGSADLGPSQQITAEEQTQKDVEPNNLPGKYTIKEGDTLFKIAENYYKDGYKYTTIAETNKLANADVIEIGQVLEIPKVDTVQVVTAENQGTGTGGSINEIAWGDKITGDTYTVTEGDWLSKIAGRAYGDIMAFNKIAQANNIADPNVIQTGTVLRIPR
jgi:nucleoid-associated protein YgaU